MPVSAIPACGSPTSRFEPFVEVDRKIDVEDGGSLNQVADATDAGLGSEESACRLFIIRWLILLDALLVRERDQKKAQLVADDVGHAIEEGHEIIEQGVRH